MTLKIYNSLTNEKEIFTPLNPPKVSMYVCGITPYDYCHLGHARTYVTFDVVGRYLRFLGYQLTLVKNFTDVDDKIINRAKNENKSFNDISHNFIQKYYQDMHRLGVLDADFEPKVTEHIDDIIQLVTRLIEKKAAYVVDGDVYFDVHQFKDYLKLSKRKLDENEAGARVAIDERKKNPFDFALWKSAKPDEPSWKSPWGQGRPGWHIECSAMAFKILGESFDIHGGGRDLIFPHHDNEIAQSEAASNKPFAHYWMHSGMLNIDNEKMSKSLGNFFTIHEVIDLVEPEAMRAFFLNAHYRNPVSFEIEYYCPQCKNVLTKQEVEAFFHKQCNESFTKEDAKQCVRFLGLEESEKRLSYIYKTLHRVYLLIEQEKLQNHQTTHTEIFNPELLKEVQEKFSEAMNDDFNTSAAISSFSPLLNFLNELLDKPKKPREKTIHTLIVFSNELKKLGKILGLYQQNPHSYCQRRKHKLTVEKHIDTHYVEQLIHERMLARQSRLFQKADEIRDQLKDLGVVLQDTPNQTLWDIFED